MQITDWTKGTGCEEVLGCYDPQSGLRAVIAVDSTRLGPALGGCRMMHYASWEEAVQDAVRLAQGMTYKSAAAGLPYGGGKAVILRDAAALGPQRAEQLRAFGRFVHRLQGRYISGIDLGTSVPDMDEVRLETPWVTDTTGSLCAVDQLTAEMTAYGVFLGIQAALEHAFGTPELSGRTVAVQGLGKVGMSLCRQLHAAGASIAAADVDAERVRYAAAHLGARKVLPERILSEPCDVLAPCALGGVLHDLSLPQLNCRVVAGAANNQLASARHGGELEQLGILYAPDYILNAGGIIATAVDLQGGNAEEARLRTGGIPGTLREVFRISLQNGISASEAADRLAESRLGGG